LVFSKEAQGKLREIKKKKRGGNSPPPPKASLGEKTRFIPCYSISTILIWTSHSILRFGGTGAWDPQFGVLYRKLYYKTVFEYIVPSDLAYVFSCQLRYTVTTTLRPLQRILPESSAWHGLGT